MAYNWKILRAAVEQEILFPNRDIYDSYISGLQRKEEPFEVLSVNENEDGTLTVVMRKRYNPGNAFFWRSREANMEQGSLQDKPSPKKKKMPVKVIVEDDKIYVRCCGGCWYVGDTDNRWLWVLNAIAFPEEYSIKISDQRQQREGHQPDMTTGEG